MTKKKTSRNYVLLNVSIIKRNLVVHIQKLFLIKNNQSMYDEWMNELINDYIFNLHDFRSDSTSESKSNLETIQTCQCFYKCTEQVLFQTPLLKSVHPYIFSKPNIVMKMTKFRLKCWKCMGKNINFATYFYPPSKKCMLCTLVKMLTIFDGP